MPDDNYLEPKQDKNKLAKIIATFVIGGAIGSVLGLAFAPQKGSETRKVMKKKTDSVIKKSQKFIKDHEQEINQIKEGGLGILSDLKNKHK